MKEAVEIGRVPIDWPALFKEAGIPTPRTCRLARSKVADAWCLFFELPDGLELHVITPPALPVGASKLVIRGAYWVFLE